MCVESAWLICARRSALWFGLDRVIQHITIYFCGSLWIVLSEYIIHRGVRNVNAIEFHALCKEFVGTLLEAGIYASVNKLYIIINVVVLLNLVGISWELRLVWLYSLALIANHLPLEHVRCFWLESLSFGNSNLRWPLRVNRNRDKRYISYNSTYIFLSFRKP